jgi:hypothetical protein
MVERIKQLVQTTPLGAIPGRDALQAIFEEFGLLSLTRRFRRALLLNILLEVDPEAPLASVIDLLTVVL